MSGQFVRMSWFSMANLSILAAIPSNTVMMGALSLEMALTAAPIEPMSSKGSAIGGPGGGAGRPPPGGTTTGAGSPWSPWPSCSMVECGDVAGLVLATQTAEAQYKYL